MVETYNLTPGGKLYHATKKTYIVVTFFLKTCYLRSYKNKSVLISLFIELSNMDIKI